jgi:hypothetical protein
MLFALLIVGIAVLTGYFLLLPMFTNLSALTDERDALKIQEDEMRLQIARTAEFQDMFDDAQAEYFRYISYFYEPMEPEMIDERITSMMIAHEMIPASLSMTTLVVEAVPLYMADVLRVSPVPVPLDSGAGAADGVAGGADGSGGSSGSGGGANGADSPAFDAANEAGGTEAAPTPTQAQAADEYGSYAFVYTIKATAYGKRDSLYDFLAQAAPMTAMEVTSFSYTDPTSKASGEKDAASLGSINMEIKLYVFVEGVMAKGQAENR